MRQTAYLNSLFNGYVRPEEYFSELTLHGLLYRVNMFHLITKKSFKVFNNYG